MTFDPVHSTLRQSSGTDAPPHGAWVRRLLFEDDREFSRTLGALFSSQGYPQGVSQKAAFATAISVFVIALGLLSTVGGSERESANGARKIADNSLARTVQADPSSFTKPIIRSGDSRVALGLPANSTGEQNYTLGPIDLARLQSATERPSQPGVLVVAQNKGSGSATVSGGFGGGGPAGGGLGGGRPRSGVLSSADGRPVAVPENESSAVLLAFALVLLLSAQRLLARRARSTRITR
jgi:hypothetical protein